MKNMPAGAKAFIFSSIVIAAGLLVYYLLQAGWSPAWLILAGLASIAQVRKVEGATVRTSYNTGWLLYGFTFLLYGAPAALFVILFAHLVEWAWQRYPWYIQSFNMAAFVLAVAAADVAFRWTNPAAEPFSIHATTAILASLSLFTLVNHLAVGMVIWLACGQNLVQSGVFNILSLLIDFTMVSLGAAASMLWRINPSSVILAVIPIYLINSTLKVPALERKIETDPKTGLYNAQFFTTAFEKELQRANRYDRPLTVILGDLDLLRNINNTYGHLAGDVVLCGIAGLLRESFHESDLVARFGGEEFSILMPETTVEQSLPVVEAARRMIEEASFAVKTSPTPIKATMSFGIAGRLSADQTVSEIMHNADMALYSAKLSGRNRTLTCTASFPTSPVDETEKQPGAAQGDCHGSPACMEIATIPFKIYV